MTSDWRTASVPQKMSAPEYDNGYGKGKTKGNNDNRFRCHSNASG
jgi:hypothetical protein